MTEEMKNSPIEHRGRILRAEMRTSATPMQAWEAWADPEKIANWFVDRAEGKAEAGATITWIFDKFNYRIPYEVLRAEPGHALAIRWEPPPGRDPGILEVTILREGGETVIRLVNSGFREGAEWNEEYEGVNSGWQMALALLKHYLENYFGMPRSSFLAMRPAEYTIEKLLPYHRSEEGLAKWLTMSGSFGAVGAAYRLALREGGIASGRVLALTKSETALSWEEIRGVMELKAFSMGPQKMICVHGCGWGWSAERAKEIERQMERALERLAAVLGAAGASA
jgi:uncharacterized protein YndB with AHSA1/START domain